MTKAASQQLFSTMGLGLPEDTNPVARIHIADNGTSQDFLALFEQDDETVSAIRLRNTSGGDYDWEFLVLDSDALQIFDIIAGAERLRISSDGDIGISEPAPAARLHIADAGTSLASILHVQQDDGTPIALRIENTTAVQEWGFTIFNDSSLTLANLTAAVFAATIISSNEIIIGGPSFVIDARLHVEDGATAFPQVLLAAQDDDSIFSLTVRHSGIGQDWGFKVKSDSALQLFDITAGVERIVIDTSGNVGIGGTGSERLHTLKAVDGSSILLVLENSQANTAASTNETAELRFGFGGDIDVARILVGKEGDYTSGAASDTFMAFYTDLNATATEGMRLTSAGQLLIGTLSPIGTELLSVVGDVDITGKLTISGLIDPTGMVFDEQATVPGGTPGSTKATLWVRDDSLLILTDDTGTDTTIGDTALTERVFAYDTTTQAISGADALQSVTFDTNDELNGWSHTAGTSAFTCDTSGKYVITVDLIFEKTGGGAQTAEMVALFNSSEVSGSQGGLDITASNATVALSRTFTLNATATQVLEIQIAGSATTVQINPGPSPSTATVIPSAAINIRRVA